ncbi:MAG: hypothetical protein R3B13_39325 [Polyangiaceae bacterium]
MQRLILSLLVCAATACGGTTRDDSTESASAAACGAFAEVLCTRMSSCAPELVGAAGPERQRYLSHDDCLRSQAAFCALSVGRADTGVTPAVVDACTQSVGASSCDALSRQYAAYGSACVVARGTRDFDAPCSTAAQCESGRCGWSEQDACGTCYKASSPKAGLPIAGDPCFTGGSCASNAICVDDICVAKTPSTQGDNCSSVFDDGPPLHCGAGEECLNQADHGGGNCTPYAREGEACGDSWVGPVCMRPWQCVGGRCRLPPVCGG